nr:annexin [Hymenolepis microstoma]
MVNIVVGLHFPLTNTLKMVQCKLKEHETFMAPHLSNCNINSALDRKARFLLGAFRGSEGCRIGRSSRVKIALSALELGPNPILDEIEDLSSLTSWGTLLDYDAEGIVAQMSIIDNFKVNIINILAHRTVAQRQAIECAYKDQYGETFYDRAHLSAAALQKAMNEGETDNDLLIDVICTSSKTKILAIKGAFQENSSGRKSLVEAIESECSGDLKRVLMATVESCRRKGFDES